MLYLVIFFLSLFLLGQNFSWLTNEYDELRLLEILLISLLGLCYLLNKKEQYISKTDGLAVFLIGLAAIFLSYWHLSIYQIYDLIQFIGLFLLFISLSHTDLTSHRSHIMMTLLLILCCIPFINLFFSVFELLSSGIWYRWQFNAGSPRVIDSVLVVLFWLGFYLKDKTGFMQKFYPVFSLLLFLGLFFDGARAALLSIIVPLFILFIMSSQQRKSVLINAIGILIAYVIFYLTHYYYLQLYPDHRILNVARYSSSGRAEMWQFAVQQWFNHPIMGLGGGYLASIQYHIAQHMHNVYFRLIFEWGIVGFVFLSWIFIKLFQLFRSEIPIVLKMGVLAIMIDGFLSGNFIYPAAQVICILFLALAFQSKTQITAAKNLSQQGVNQKYLFALFYCIFIILVVSFLGDDFLCRGCAGMQGTAWPYFWEYGHSTGLEK